MARSKVMKRDRQDDQSNDTKEALEEEGKGVDLEGPPSVVVSTPDRETTAASVPMIPAADSGIATHFAPRNKEVGDENQACGTGKHQLRRKRVPVHRRLS